MLPFTPCRLRRALDVNLNYTKRKIWQQKNCFSLSFSSMCAYELCGSSSRSFPAIVEEGEERPTRKSTQIGLFPPLFSSGADGGRGKFQFPFRGCGGESRVASSQKAEMAHPVLVIAPGQTPTVNKAKFKNDHKPCHLILDK